MSLPDRPDWDDREFDLVLPFVDVVSVGGPYDDLAYTAGYQVGKIDGILEKGKETNLLAATFLIYSRSIKQVDLIAMRHNFKFDLLHDDGEWAQVGVTRN